MMEFNQIHSFYPNEDFDKDDKEEDLWKAQREVDDWVEEQRNLYEHAYCIGDIEMVNIFVQKFNECFKNFSVSAFRQCGHQRVCQNCYENKGDVDIIKCIVCKF